MRVLQKYNQGGQSTAIYAIPVKSFKVKELRRIFPFWFTKWSFYEKKYIYVETNDKLEKFKIVLLSIDLGCQCTFQWRFPSNFVSLIFSSHWMLFGIFWRWKGVVDGSTLASRILARMPLWTEAGWKCPENWFASHTIRVKKKEHQKWALENIREKLNTVFLIFFHFILFSYFDNYSFLFFFFSPWEIF